MVSLSPGGPDGPKDRDPARVKALHDAFRKAMDDPKRLEPPEPLRQDLGRRGGEGCAKWSAETFASDRALIERQELAAK